MKAQELFKELRKIVREEITIILKKELKEAFSGQILQEKKEKYDFTGNGKTSIPRQILSLEKENIQKTLSKNPVLNRILAETAKSSTMSKFIHDNQIFNKGVKELNLTSKDIMTSSPESDESILDKADQLPLELTNALTKDYSALMKKFKEKGKG